MMQWLIDAIRFLQYGDLPTSYYTRRGMKVGINFNRQSGTRLDPSHCWLIEIGNNVTLSNKVQILAHDDSIRVYLGYGKIGRVVIGDNVFIGASSTVLMGVHIGCNVIIGAGSVVAKDIPDGAIAAGVPAKVIGNTSDLINRSKIEMLECPVFDASWNMHHHQSSQKKQEMREKLSDRSGFIELGYFKDIQE